jgi:hypothetical protein
MKCRVEEREVRCSNLLDGNLVYFKFKFVKYFYNISCKRFDL